MHCFLQETKISQQLTPMEAMVALLAAVSHDLDHPGVNQSFLVATKSHLAALYNVRFCLIYLVTHNFTNFVTLELFCPGIAPLALCPELLLWVAHLWPPFASTVAWNWVSLAAFNLGDGYKSTGRVSRQVSRRCPAGKWIFSDQTWRQALCASNCSQVRRSRKPLSQLESEPEVEWADLQWVLPARWFWATARTHSDSHLWSDDHDNPQYSDR